MIQQVVFSLPFLLAQPRSTNLGAVTLLLPGEESFQFFGDDAVGHALFRMTRCLEPLFSTRDTVGRHALALVFRPPPDIDLLRLAFNLTAFGTLLLSWNYLQAANRAAAEALQREIERETAKTTPVNALPRTFSMVYHVANWYFALADLLSGKQLGLSLCQTESHLHLSPTARKRK